MPLMTLPMKNGFEITKGIDIIPPNEQFYLHTHKDRHEILLFLDGKCEFHVEGNVYQLNPGDLVIAATNELHRIIHTELHRYERYIISVRPEFFVTHDCAQYACIFEKKLPGIGNYFPASFVKEENIYNIIQKIYLYREEDEEPVSQGALFELLYKLRKGRNITPGSVGTSIHVRNAITYINSNLASDLSLPVLADQVHIRGEYLSRLFKEQMKISIKKYITYKRLLCARQLYQSGHNLLEASLDAGFTNYSNFYRMYMKEFGQAPSSNLKDE